MLFHYTRRPPVISHSLPPCCSCTTPANDPHASNSAFVGRQSRAFRLHDAPNHAVAAEFVAGLRIGTGIARHSFALFPHHSCQRSNVVL